ncbi:hypothetical protein ACMD2_23659 [Ananas comosus]|uniref:DUF7725 domain-containing protein n=1 Tax=Ananas comosus TaxID=4615 RepID=A0A199VTS9_ANACO|nr:hypothetical protein ACMD2_23659 [Ananas comosus]
MEASASRGGSLPVPSSSPSSSSQQPRKEWRAVSQHSFRSNGSEDSEHVKLGQPEERTIYEVQEGMGPFDVDFSSIMIDGRGLNDDILQRKLQNIARQREELQHMEIELRAQAIARGEILEAQSGFEARMKEQDAAAAKLKEQLQERENYILELERKLEENNRELRALRIDTEAAWAKEDLLREQNKELATFRRERDNSEAERAQLLKQIRDLQEHIQEKDNQFIALEEQHKVAQDTIIYKDEQLREVQAWITRVQEMDALQSTTNQSLQAELRERTEQFNHYWIGFQQQYVEMERHHLQVIQQLQLELAEAREQNVTHKDGSGAASESSADSSSYVQSKGSQINANDGGSSNGNLGFVTSERSDDGSSLNSASNPPRKTEHSSGVPVVPSSLLGVGAFFPPGQMAAMHPYVMQPQGVPQSVTSTNSPVPPSQLGHLQPASATPHHHWPDQQVAFDVSQVPNQTHYQSSQSDQNLLRSDAHSSYQHSVEGHVVQPDHLSVHISQEHRARHAISGSSEVQALELNGKQHAVSLEPQETLDVNSEGNSTQKFDVREQKSESKVQDENVFAANKQSQEPALLQQCSAPGVVASAPQVHGTTSNGAAECHKNVVNYAEIPSSVTWSSSSLPTGKAVEPALLDERSLLACIVRAIPAGSDGRIRISTTLPNRLGKMLAPLHWHDYKKHYGKLDDFVAHHPELFVIEGDFIHLREGAQQIISATTAVAKVAAAAASASQYSSLLPSVAVTPVAQNNRQKRVPQIEPRSVNTMSFANGAVISNPGDSFDMHSQTPKMHDQQQNGVNLNSKIVQGLSDMAISNKLKGLQDPNGFLPEIRPGQSSVHVGTGNGGNLERTILPSSQNKGPSNGRHGSGGKQQGRSSGAGLISRR